MHVEIHGLQTADAPTLVFSSGLGGAAHFWTPQLADLGRDHRVILYDQAGTGKSPATLPAGYGIGDMADELQHELTQRGVDAYHLVGHALGGLVALELASRAAPGLASLVLMNAWAHPSPHTARCFSVRKKLLRDSGPAAYVEAQALFLYPPTWIDSHAAELAEEDQRLLAAFPHAGNLLTRIEALLAYRPGERLQRIETPTLLIANRDDMLVPWTCSEQLENLLPNARLALLDSGGHASSVTRADTINGLVRSHLSQARTHNGWNADPIPDSPLQ